MFWIRSGLQSMSTSISDWLTPAPAVAAAPGGMLDVVREAMVDALGEAGCRQRATLALRIAAAKDAQGLWALRPELMTAACQLHGEAEGHQRLAAVTALFDSLLPAPLTRRRGRRRMAA